MQKHNINMSHIVIIYEIYVHNVKNIQYTYSCYCIFLHCVGKFDVLMLHKLIPLHCRLPETGDLSLKHVVEFIFKDNL